MKKVAIGGGQGFWGDSPDAAIHMIRNADIQYMGCDYLAELTLSIMAKQQLKDPTKGFAPDFTTRILKEAGKEAWDKRTESSVTIFPTSAAWTASASGQKATA